MCDHSPQFLPEFWNLVKPMFLMEFKCYSKILPATNIPFLWASSFYQPSEERLIWSLMFLCCLSWDEPFFGFGDPSKRFCNLAILLLPEVQKKLEAFLFHMVKCKLIPSQLSPRTELELFKCHTNLSAVPRPSVVCHTALADPITVVKCSRKFQYRKKYTASKQEA